MLKRIYAHNYKCLVNFEMAFDQPVSLLMGANGSGKSSVFDVLREIHKFVVINSRLDDRNDPAFQNSTLTRWLDESVQRFEIDAEGNGGVYHYLVEIKHYPENGQNRVRLEKLLFNNQSLYEFKAPDGTGLLATAGLKCTLFSDDPTESGTPYSTNSSISGLGTITDTNNNKKLTWFKNWLQNLFIIKIVPDLIADDFAREESYPEQNMSNFPAWLNYWNNENREGLALVEESLKQIIGDFSSFKFTQAGIRKILEVKLKGKYTLNFSELSDGQKALAILYTLAYCVPEGSTVCIDEPDNFLALPEIQPWLDVLRDHFNENGIQALLISHHPSLINFLAPNSGYWFSREDNHSRIERIKHEEGDGLTLAELIEQGWAYGG